jgi:hypothetical protein
MHKHHIVPKHIGGSDDPERQKAHSEKMKIWWKQRKEERVGT